MNAEKSVQDAPPPALTSAEPKRALPYAIAGRKWLPDFVTKLVFGKTLRPTREEWQQVVSGLSKGDPYMDRVVAWMFDSHPGKAKAMFEQALTRGIETVENPPEPLQAFFEHIDRGPSWLNRQLLVDGAVMAQANGMVGFYVLRDMALMGGYVYFSSLNQALVATGSLEKDVALRLGETGKWLADVTTPHGLERFAEGFITTIRVRMVHALIRRALLKRQDFDTATWGVPINQIDMLATYLAFGPVTLLGARIFGVPIGLKQSRAAMHMWRYIGWLSGVEEQWLAVTERDGLRTLYHTFQTHPFPDENIKALGTALMREPLTRSQPELEGRPWWAKLVRFYNYHKHISNSALILGPVQRKRLGLPMFAVPWYPLLSAPFRFLLITCCRLLGGKAMKALAERNLAAQRRLLSGYFGDKPAAIITPRPEHPAHVG